MPDHQSQLSEQKGRSTKRGKPYDLKQRTFLFASQIVQLVNGLPKTIAGAELGKQLIRAGTSVGANLEEADDASSVKDFIYKAGIARREAKESRYWLKLLIHSKLSDGERAIELHQESDELVRILSSIIAKAQQRQQSPAANRVRDTAGWLKAIELS